VEEPDEDSAICFNLNGGEFLLKFASTQFRHITNLYIPISTVIDFTLVKSHHTSYSIEAMPKPDIGLQF
jgi:hypothetical protein